MPTQHKQYPHTHIHSDTQIHTLTHTLTFGRDNDVMECPRAVTGEGEEVLRERKLCKVSVCGQLEHPHTHVHVVSWCRYSWRGRGRGRGEREMSLVKRCQRYAREISGSEERIYLESDPSPRLRAPSHRPHT